MIAHVLCPKPDDTRLPCQINVFFFKTQNWFLYKNKLKLNIVIIFLFFMFYYITTQNVNLNVILYVFNMMIYDINTKYLIMKTKTNYI